MKGLAWFLGIVAVLVAIVVLFNEQVNDVYLVHAILFNPLALLLLLGLIGFFSWKIGKRRVVVNNDEVC